MNEILNVESVRKRYGRRTVLRDVSFEVGPGEVVGLLGANGAGKSTLLRIVAGIDRPDGGTVRLDRGAVGAMLDPSWLDRRLTCRDHIQIALRAHGLDPRQRVVDRVLRSVGLAEALGRRVNGLSLGMRQRLALAVATVHAPRLLILDEPVNGLDPDGVLWFRSLLRDFADNGGAVLLSSHLMSEMERIADRVVLLDKGTVHEAEASSGWGDSRFVVIESRSDLRRLRDPIGSAGGVFRAEQSGAAQITGLDAEAVFLIAASSGVPLTRLSEESASLEDYYRAAMSGAGHARR
ncbi:MAG: ATP-binding cassette domain-containing protein [Rhodococcus sp. (in: high G+C Gram-positive bacteria)]